MKKRTKEWIAQSNYDMDTAVYMFKGGRNIYAVFMCHLSIEKALKGLFYENAIRSRPNRHNLVYLLTEIGIKPPVEYGKFIVKIGEACIPTRYTENLEKLQGVTRLKSSRKF